VGRVAAAISGCAARRAAVASRAADRREAEHHVQPPGAPARERARVALHARRGAERHRDVERAADVGAEEPARRDAHHGDGHAVERERAPDDVRGTAEAPLPERMADHRDGPVRPAAGPVVGRCKGAPEGGGDAQHLEHPPARPEPFDGISGAAPGEVEARQRVGEGAVV
jgi:hypothetical protein